MGSRTPFAIVTGDNKVVRSDVLAKYAADEAGQSRQIEDPFTEQYGTLGLKQPLYNPDTLARLLEMNVYHYRSCRTKARDTAGLGWMLTPKNDSPSDEQRKRVEEIFDNFETPLQETFTRAQLDYESIGWGAVEIVRAKNEAEGEVVQIHHIPGHTVRVHVDRNKYAQVRGAQRVWFKKFGYPYDVHAKHGTEHELGSLSSEDRANELMMWTNYTTRSDFYGLPDVMPALGAIHGDISRRDYNIEFFNNFGVPSYAVWITGDFDPGEPDEEGVTPLEKTLQQRFNELAKSPHSTLVMSVPTPEGQGDAKVDIKLEPLSTDVKEASFRMYRKDNRDEVLASHAVPPYRIGIAEEGALGGSTAKESTEVYKRSVVEPRQSSIELAMNQILRDGLEVDDWAFEFQEIDNTDLQFDLQLAQGLFGMGAMTPRMVMRHFEDYFGLDSESHTDPALDEFYIGGQPITGENGPEAEQAMMSRLEQKIEEANTSMKSVESDWDSVLVETRKTFEEVRELIEDRGGVPGPKGDRGPEGPPGPDAEETAKILEEVVYGDDH